MSWPRSTLQAARQWSVCMASTSESIKIKCSLVRSRSFAALVWHKQLHACADTGICMPLSERQPCGVGGASRDITVCICTDYSRLAGQWCAAAARSAARIFLPAPRARVERATVCHTPDRL